MAKLLQYMHYRHISQLFHQMLKTEIDGRIAITHMITCECILDYILQFAKVIPEEILDTVLKFKGMKTYNLT